MHQAETLPEVRPYFPGTPLSPPSAVTLSYPITLSARGKFDYFVPRESFNVLAMFKNPMMMLMLVAGGLVLFTPTMMVCVPSASTPTSLRPCVTARCGLELAPWSGI